MNDAINITYTYVGVHSITIDGAAYTVDELRQALAERHALRGQVFAARLEAEMLRDDIAVLTRRPHACHCGFRSFTLRGLHVHQTKKHGKGL